ncbi:MAG: hypothetical protein Q8P73_02820 [bacterium]|nr:hypothetical protein [bacterium]MDZ4341979.1 hypothetical protein [Candidatus Binatia bacterium]
MVKKLNPIIVRDKLVERGLIIFTPQEFRTLFGVSTGAARKFIHSYTKKSLFMKLRNGLYTLNEKQPSPYVIANKLYQPSYISLETALSFHQLIPEVVYSITSITTKATREFAALNQSFSYTRFKKSIFQGYQLVTHGTDRFLMAEPEKAVADYLYLVALSHKPLNDRLSLDRFSQQKLQAWVRLFQSRRLTQLLRDLYAHHPTN